jgi:hypothetical protein
MSRVPAFAVGPWLALGAALLAAPACEPSADPPASFVDSLRVLAIKADPPEVASGASATLTMFAVDGTSPPPSVSWSRCLRAPLPGQTINPDCVSNLSASPPPAYIEPIGTGPTVSATMPDTTSGAFGEPDASGGVYLPIIAKVTSASDQVIASYGLRLTPASGAGQAVNQNPTLTNVFVDDGSGAGSVPLDEATPRVVHKGDTLQLAVTYAPGSAESYVAQPAGQAAAPTTEVLTTSWFTTAGELDHKKTSDERPQNVLHLDARLPAAGAIIDLYIVGHDERGGTDYLHRTLQLQ